MDFQEAIRKIEERGDFNRYAEVKPVFEEELKHLKKDSHTERGLSYYYLLVSYLKAQLVHETEESIEFYESMDKEFMAQEKIYKAKPVKQGAGHHKFSQGEVQDFYRLMERCYNSLEFLYQRHSFKMRRSMAYERKMRFRKNAHYFNREIGGFLEYKFLEITCKYGTSVPRWALTTLAFTVLFALAYLALDRIMPEQMILAEDRHWYDYFYFSIIITTTVGLGDIAPVTLLGKILVSIEAFAGFMMLGVFMGMMQKRL